MSDTEKPIQTRKLLTTEVKDYSPFPPQQSSQLSEAEQIDDASPKLIQKIAVEPVKKTEKLVRAIGFQLGLRGDIAMSTVAARVFKQAHPYSHLTLGISRKFKDLAPLFHDHPYFDSVHLYEEYVDWPSTEDRAYLEACKYDMVFHGKPEHRDANWWEQRHQYAEAVHMTGLEVPSNINPVMTKWFHIPKYPDLIAFAPFGGNNEKNDKMLSVELAQGIVNWLRSSGWRVVHLGAANESDLFGAPRPRLSYFDSVRLMLGCRALIHCDTGLGHFAGAYGLPSFGLYGYRYFTSKYVHQIQPLHKDFYPLNAKTMEEHCMENIAEHLKIFLS